MIWWHVEFKNFGNVRANSAVYRFARGGGEQRIKQSLSGPQAAKGSLEFLIATTGQVRHTYIQLIHNIYIYTYLHIYMFTYLHTYTCIQLHAYIQTYTASNILIGWSFLPLPWNKQKMVLLTSQKRLRTISSVPYATSVLQKDQLKINRIFQMLVLRNIYTSSSRASRGRKFQKKKEVYSKERICL